jgi:hypothetical protein
MAVHNMTLFNSVGTMVNTFNSFKIWLIFIFVGGTCALIDFTILAFNYSFNRNIVTLLQLMYNSIGKIEYEDDAPEEVKEKLKIVNQYDEKKKDNEEIELNKKITLLRGDTNGSKVDHSNAQFIDQDNNLFKIKNNKSNSNTDRNSNRSERIRLFNKNNKRHKKVNSSEVSDSNDKKNNNKSNSKSNSYSSSNSYSKSESNNNKGSYSNSYSNSNSRSIKSSGKASYNDNDSDIRKDIPKKTMEYMSRYRIDEISTIKKNNNSGMSSDKDTVGENYNDEFSEKMGNELNYFFPKQANITNRSHNYFSEEYSHNNK